MLTFFRRIRKSLLASGATRKYLVYAGGEVLLVMIGILLALQVNNWNEWRKERAKEVILLNEIAQNIELNIQIFDKFSSGLDKYAEHSDYVLAVLNGEKVYSDTVDHKLNEAIYRRNNIEYSSASYEVLKSTGYDIIRNDSLKKEIIRLFEYTYPRMMNDFDWGGHESQPEYMDHHFFPILTEDELIWEPYDFNVQLNDNYFKSLIQKIKIQRGYYVDRVQNPLWKSKRVLQLIKDELSESE